MLQRLTRRSRCGGLGPFEHLTGRARQAVTLAQDQARSLGHNYLGTEHLLLGLLVEGHGIAFRALDQLEVSAAAVRAEVEMIIGRGPQPPTGPIAFTPRTKKALELAWCEAKRLGHDDVGTEHLLLGLVREGEGLAAQVLHRLGVDRAAVIEQVMRLGSTSRPRSQQARRTFILDELAQVFDQNEQLAAEVVRLQALLRRHGIQPDGGSSQTA